MPLPLVVINPNSNAGVTAGIDAALQPLRVTGGPPIVCLTLEGGPPAVQSQQDMALVAPMLARLVNERQAQAAAFVIACFSDPGLALVREISPRPVFGIGECAVLDALTRGQRFGVIAMSSGARERHLRTYGAMGVLARFAQERSVDLNMVELADRQTTLTRLLEVGRQLRDEHQADVLIMGCAGMAAYREPLERALRIPVVEPSQAAAAMALGRILLNGEPI